jgi:hypothetical protein
MEWRTIVGKQHGHVPNVGPGVFGCTANNFFLSMNHCSRGFEGKRHVSFIRSRCIQSQCCSFVYLMCSSMCRPTLDGTRQRCQWSKNSRHGVFSNCLGDSVAVPCVRHPEHPVCAHCAASLCTFSRAVRGIEILRCCNDLGVSLLLCASC